MATTLTGGKIHRQAARYINNGPRHHSGWVGFCSYLADYYLSTYLHLYLGNIVVKMTWPFSAEWHCVLTLGGASGDIPWWWKRGKFHLHKLGFLPWDQIESAGSPVCQTFLYLSIKTSRPSHEEFSHSTRSQLTCLRQPIRIELEW